MRATVDALKVGDAALLAEALAVGLGAAVVPSLFATVALVTAWHLGQATTVAEGGALAVALALMSMLASGPFMLAASTLGSVTDSARAIARIAGTKLNNEDFERRAGRLEEAGSFADTFAQSFWILVAGVATLFVAGALLTPTAVQVEEKLNLAHPAITYAALLGAVLVLVYAGGVLGAASRSMRGVVAEVQRQLRGFPKERGKSQVPTDYIPSYRACIEIVAKSALSRHLVPVLLAVLLPLLLGPLISGATAASPATVRAALATFVLASAVTGLTASFAAEAVRTCVGSIRRQARGKPGGAEAGIHAHGFAELLGGAAGPAALLVFKTAAVGTLAVAPFLS
jgi:K(+)-stimulated pyrophosphate-energized sodium pump